MVTGGGRRGPVWFPESSSFSPSSDLSERSATGDVIVVELSRY